MSYFKIIFLGIFIFPYTVLLAQKAPFDPQQYIEWNKFYELSWENFEGKPTEDAIGDAGTAIRIIAKPYYVGNKIHYQVYALFDKKKSWAIEQGDALLAHEQLHFDIAELYARKIRKKVKEMAKRNEKDLNRYNKAVKELLAESNAVDLQYDLETLHGAIRDKQEYWQNKIDRQMEQLKAFEKKQRTIGLNYATSKPFYADIV